jgi:hypothetical protein
VADLARVGPQGVDLPADRRADVDADGRVVRPEEVEPPDVVGGQAVAGQPRERHRVARCRVGGVDGGHARRPVIRVVDPAVAVEERLGVGGEDGVRAERPDLADEELPQGEVVGEGPVWLVEEADPRIAHDRRRDPLLGLAEGGQGERVGLRVLAARVAARAADEPADGSSVDPAGGRRRRAEVRVVGVRR